MKDAAQEFYESRSKSMLRNTEPYAVAALLLVVAPFFGLWAVPFIIPVTSAAAVVLAIASLVRLSRSDKYQGKTIAITSLVLGALQLIISIVALVLLAQ